MTARTAAQIAATSRLDHLVTERELQTTIIEIAQRLGWETHHQHDSRHSTAGWPDLVLAKAPQLLFAELKTEVGKVSAEQCHWLELLADCGCEVHVVRPSGLDAFIARLQEQRP